MSAAKGRWKGVCTEVAGPDQSTLLGVPTFGDATGLLLKSNVGVRIDDEQNLEVNQGNVLIEGVAGVRGVVWSDGGALASVAYSPASSSLMVQSEAALSLSAASRLDLDTTAGWRVEGVTYNKAQVKNLFTVAGLALAQGDLLYGASGASWSRLPKDPNTPRYLANSGTSNNPKWDQVDLANGVKGNLSVSSLAPVDGQSVLGNSTASSPGAVSPIPVGENSFFGRVGAGALQGIAVPNNHVVGNPGGWKLSSFPCTAAGRAIIGASDASAQRAALDLRAQVKTADTDRSATTLPDDPHLTRQVVAGQRYALTFWLQAFNVSGSGGITLGIAYPASSSARWNVEGDTGMLNEGSTFTHNLATFARGFFFRGQFLAGSNGTFAIRWGHSTGGSGLVRLAAGSYLMLAPLG